MPSPRDKGLASGQAVAISTEGNWPVRGDLSRAAKKTEKKRKSKPMGLKGQKIREIVALVSGTMTGARVRAPYEVKEKPEKKKTNCAVI